jgi:ribosomal protein L3 glutamine methyltransferase
MADITGDLITVRDWLRYAVTRFNAAEVFHGHGATSAVDEAAFIVLESLSLPVDDINPWLDCRLTGPERARLAALVEARVTTRKPAAYLLGKTYIRGVPFKVDERVIVPRSFIGEMLFDETLVGEGGMLVDDVFSIERVLDLCTGSGCLALLAAQVFPNATVDAVDLSADALEVAKINVAESPFGDRVTLHRGDLFAPLAGRRYDLILTNPPYVEREVMDVLPPEYRHEPEMALAGGPDGLDVVRRILAAAPKHLNPGGGLLCEIGTGREIMDEEYPHLPFVWLDSEDSEGEVFWITARDLGVE